MPVEALGPWPENEILLNTFNVWALMEYPDKDGNGMTDLFEAAWNPLATTWLDEAAVPRRQDVDIGYGPGKWNDANGGRGVGIYATAESGITATVLTLSLPNYRAIHEAFSTLTWNDRLEGAFKTWIGSPGYSRDLSDFFKSAVESHAALTPVQELNAAVMDRFRLIGLAADMDHLRVNRVIQILRKEGMLFN